jgi:lipopolysaccharide/colanic/teichoic acid biosynthesis glycosyltransferase
MIQRFFDITLSFTAIILFMPLLLPICVALKFTGEGEILYIQQRVGSNGTHFGLLKFATMLKNSPNIGAGEITLKNDPRVLPLGKFLRKSKLNELPQLLNILLGHMSVVGPRPMVPKTFEQYPQEAKEIIGSVKPGLTGIGSIVFRDEEKYLQSNSNPRQFYLDIIIPHKANLEVWYVRNHNVFLYFKIIFMTAWVVCFPASKINLTSFNGLPSEPRLKV